MESLEIVMESIICARYGMMASMPCAISAVDRHFSPPLCLFSPWPSVPPPYHSRAPFTMALRPSAAVPCFSHATNSSPVSQRPFSLFFPVLFMWAKINKQAEGLWLCREEENNIYVCGVIGRNVFCFCGCALSDL